MNLPIVIAEPRQLEQLVEQLRGSSSIAVDVEADGMFAFRPRLCTVQLAWPTAEGLASAVVDALAVDVAPLGSLLSEGGPVKLLHDLTFDARMLSEAGIVLGNVRDTSVAARFLGEENTGLASLAERYCGASLGKTMQNHNWAERPLTASQLTYLAGDVIHLHELDRALRARADELAIAGEIAVECAYKLATALAPPRDERPAYARIKGFQTLEPVAQAVLRRLVLERDRIAERYDVPAHRVLPARTLIELANERPAAPEALRRRWRGRFAREHVHGVLEAISRGVEDGAPPAEEIPPPPPPPSPAERARRRRIEAELTRWRRDEAKRRGVNVQVVMPGHCMGPVASALLAEPTSGFIDRLRRVEGICAGRVDRYGAELSRLADAVDGVQPTP